VIADLLLRAKPGRKYAGSGIMLARVRRSGLFELLTAEAWALALGYPPAELSGKSLCELMAPGQRAAAEVVAALLDEENVQPLEITLRCKDERRKCFRLYRRFDAYEQAIFVVADEVSGEWSEALKAYG
jgi:PAS domain-containing protein